MKRFSVLIILLIVFCLNIFAYNLRKGDILFISAFGYPEMSSNSVVVGPYGEISVPPLGRFNVEGDSLETVEALLNQKMKDYVKNTKVTIGVVSYAPFKVIVLGGMKGQGIINIGKESIKFSELLGMIGGADPSQNNKAVIKYSNGKEVTVDLSKLITSGLKEDPVVTADTLVLFPTNTEANLVTVFSDFGTKSFPYNDSLTLKQVIASLGVLTEQIDNDISIIRDGNNLTYSLKNIVSGKDFPLLKGDTLLIRKNKSFIYLFSEKGGKLISYSKDLTLKQLIATSEVPTDNIDDEIIVIRNGNIITNSLSEMKEKNKDFSLLPDDTVYLKKSSNFLYYFSERGGKAIQYIPGLTLNQIMAYIDISFNSLDDQIIVSSGGKVQAFSIRDVKEGKANIPLKNNDTITIKKSFNYVYIFPDFTGGRNIDFVEGMTLKQALTIMQIPIDQIDDQIIILREDKSTVNFSVAEIINGKDMYLTRGDNIFVKKSSNYVYVFADNGTKTLPFSKDLTLKQIISSTQLPAAAIDENIVLLRNGEIINLNLNDLLNGKDFVINKGDNVFIRSAVNYVYLFSDGITKSVNYVKDMTLKQIISSSQIPVENLEDEVSILRDGKTTTASLKSSINEKDFILQRGDTLFLNKAINNYVYLFFDSGTKLVPYSKDLTIKQLIATSQLPMEAVDNDIELIRNEEIKKYDLNKILEGSDYKLEKGDTIVLKKFEKFVYALLDSNLKRVDFFKKEEMNVSSLLAKLSINNEAVEKITSEGTLLTANSTFNKGQYIKIDLIKKVVYLSGSFLNTGKITFDFNETLSLNKIIAYAKGFQADFSGKIVAIDPFGNSKSYEINTKDMTKNPEVQIIPGTSLIAVGETRSAYIVGDVSTVVEYPRGATLYDILAAYNLNQVFDIRIMMNDKEQIINAGEKEKLKAVILSGKVFIEVTKNLPTQIIVYKEGETVVVDTTKKVKIIDVFSAVKGFSPVQSGMIKIFYNGKITSTYTQDDIQTIKSLDEVKPGSYVMIQPDSKYSFISVFGNTSPKSIKTEIPLALTAILTQSGINWSTQFDIILYEPEGTKRTVKIDNFDAIRGEMVKPGTMIYVPMPEKQAVIVLGEVKSPGILQYSKNMTLIEAILRSGGLSSSAEPGNIFYFKDGPDKPPVSLNISTLLNSGTIPSVMNPEVKPGDIIFVPKSLLTTVFEVMGIVNQFTGFLYTSTYNLNQGINFYNSYIGPIFKPK